MRPIMSEPVRQSRPAGADPARWPSGRTQRNDPARRDSRDRTHPESHDPTMTPRQLRMTPTFFHLLLSLSEEVKHGYAMMQEIEERTDGGVRLGPSSLYYSLGRLEDAGLIAETDDVCDDGDDPHEERRKYYRLTLEGRRRLREETEILAGIVDDARARGIVG